MKRRTKLLLGFLVVVTVAAVGTKVASAVGPGVPVPPPERPGPDPCLGDDLLPPVLAMPQELRADATSPLGATVTFTITGADNCGAATVLQSLASGATFPIGDTPLFAVATDGGGRQTFGLTMVHVDGVPEQLARLLTDVAGVGDGTSLADAVRNAAAGDSLYRICHRLEIVAARIGRQTPTVLAAELAAKLTGDVRRIQAAAGCGAITFVDGTE